LAKEIAAVVDQTIYPMMGMGSNGSSMTGASGMMSPDVIRQIMMMQQQGGGAGGAPAAPGMAGGMPGGMPQMPPPGNPMQLIQQQQQGMQGGGMPHPGMMPPGAGGPPPMPPGASGNPQQQGVLSGVGGAQGLADLLNKMRNGQSGVAPANAPQQPGQAQTGQGGLAGQIPAWWSMAQQYMNPYGATGNGMPPIMGANGMAGGGV
jgi:hypothetical protein